MCVSWNTFFRKMACVIFYVLQKREIDKYIFAIVSNSSFIWDTYTSQNIFS